MHFTIVTASRSPQIGNGLTYDAAGVPIREGDLVRVLLRTKVVEGVVLARHERAATEESYVIKPVEESLGHLLPPVQAALARWMVQEYFCTLRSVLTVMLPAPPWSKLLPQTVLGYRTREGVRLSEKNIRGSMHQAVIDALHDRGWMDAKTVREETGASLATLRSLEMQEIILRERRRVQTHAQEQRRVRPGTIDKELQKRARQIMADRRPTLCWMGLDERSVLYLALAAQALSDGRQTIVLYPEVLLADEAAEKFSDTFGEGAVSLLHSRMTTKQRRDEWRAIRSGERRIVVGTRTALFAPCAELGLVIVDDEQEWTYKSEKTPRYLLRPVAETLCTLASATLVLGTAVPSVEVYAKTISGDAQIVRSSIPMARAGIPSAGSEGNIRIIDLNTVQFGDAYPFSPVLLHAVVQRLQRGEQSLLFFNRRGAGTALLCEDCRRRVVSKDGNVPLIVHRDTRGNPFLADHVTGLKGAVPSVCPSCGSPRLKIIGAGTQSVEDIVHRLLPTARILRSDRDVSSPEDTEEMLRKFREKRADILVGTRSIVKSFSLPSVTLAAVILADTGLSVPDFRSGERVFQLLAQLRETHARRPQSELIIQTYRPDAPEIALAATNQERYLSEELMLRTAMGYPPAQRMIRLLFQGADAHDRASGLAGSIQELLPKGGSCTVGTCLHDVRMWQVLLRCERPHALLKKIDLRGAVVDVDPVECA